MSKIIIYSGYNEASKDFAEANKDSVDYVFDWYKDEDKRKFYVMGGNPSPSGFPSVVVDGVIIREPADIADALTKVADKKVSATLSADAQLWTAKNASGVFSKLQIRRGLRAMGDEAKLDALLDASAEFKSDWSDASEIDLNDEMTQQALSQSDINIEALKTQILGV